VIYQFEAVFIGQFFLQFFQFGAKELNHFTAFNIHHVVMMLAGFQLIQGLAIFKLVLDHQTGRFKLVKHAIDCRQPDIGLVIAKSLIKVVSGEVFTGVLFQKLKNLHARRGHFKARLFDKLASHGWFRRRFLSAFIVSFSHSNYRARLMKTNFAALLLGFSVLLSSGCLYKQPVQQGNILKKEDVEEVRKGMSKRQVALILGTPAIADPFHQNRWDYVNTSKIKGKFLPVKKLVIHFENGQVSRIEDHYFADDEESAENSSN